MTKKTSIWCNVLETRSSTAPVVHLRVSVQQFTCTGWAKKPDVFERW